MAESISYSDRCRGGFTLLEALVAVTVISLFAGTVVVVIDNVQDSTRAQKLRKDASTLNAAVKIYLGNGGDLDGVSDPATVLAKLKTATTSTAHKQLVGLTGSVLDFRTKAVMQTPGEANSDMPRVLWNPAQLRFVVSTSGAAGVAKFVLDSNALVSQGKEDRYTNLQYANEGQWVWDYSDRSGGERGPSIVPQEGDGDLFGSLNMAELKALDPPIIESVGGEIALAYYPLTVAVTDPNLPGISQVMFATTPGVWSPYTGPVEIEPGSTLEVMAVSKDPDRWLDSSPASEHYEVIRIAPELAVSLPSAVDYVSMGGALMPGAYPAPDYIAPGRVALANAAEIPARYQSSAYFQVNWTFDGSDPISSSNRYGGDAFADGFPSQEIPLAMTEWGSSETLTVNVAAESFDPNVFAHSAVTTASIPIETIALRAPTITVDSSTVEITFDTNSGDMPAGARIFYNTDGRDPGIDANGNPIDGIIYSGPFLQFEDAEIIARVYAPSEYSNWFVPSESTLREFISPYSKDVFIAGRFALPDGTFRNVARLGEDGSVDATFNPGLGASYGSIVASLAPASGGRIVVGGDFDAINNVARGALARLLPDGSVDPAFDAGLTNDPPP